MRNHSYTAYAEGTAFFRRTARAVVACVTALALSVTPVGAAVQSGGRYYPKLLHEDVVWEKRDPGPMNSKKLDGYLEELDKRTKGSLAGTEGNREKIRKLYRKIIREVDRLAAGNTLAEIRRVQDVKDDKAMKKSLETTELLTEARGSVYLSLKKALDTEEGKVLKEEMGEADAAYVQEYREMSDEERKYSADLEELYSQYERKCGDLEELSGEEEIRDFEEEMTDLLHRIVKIQKEQAKSAGYDNYEDYAYREIWGRDYTPEDIRKASKVVKEKIVPLYASVSALARKSGAADRVSSDFDRICREVGAHMGEIDEELDSAFSYMQRNHLVDFREDGKKADQGFTQSMKYYGDAYIFNAPEGGYRDWQVLIHEFGHFNAAYHDDTPALLESSYMDVAEIQSQGLEALMTEYFPEIFGERDGQALKIAELESLLNAALQGFQVQEFEDLLYRKTELTAEELNREFARLEAEYGLIDASWVSEGDNFWTQIPHIFEQSFYYISYATSVLPALDIWYTSLHDRESAVDTYMKISAMSDSSYVTVLEEAGLPDYISSSGMKRVCGHIRSLADELENSGRYSRNPAGEVAAEAYLFMRYFLVGKGIGEVL